MFITSSVSRDTDGGKRRDHEEKMFEEPNASYKAATTKLLAGRSGLSLKV